MNVELPSTGCNVINSSTSFYNYSPDAKTRTSYVIYDGKALVQGTSYNQYGYTYSGDCLVTGDLKYHPEIEVYFPIISFCIVCFLFCVIYKMMIKRLMP